MKKRKTLGSLLGSLALLAVGVATTGRVPGAIDVSDVPLMAFTASMTDTSAATRLAAEAGSHSAGVYLDRAGHVNVAVTSRTAADRFVGAVEFPTWSLGTRPISPGRQRRWRPAPGFPVPAGGPTP